MGKRRSARRPRYERMIVSLPAPLVARVRRLADIVRDGNKSGFVADAIQAYIDHLRKPRHTEKLRQSYAASAGDSAAIAQAWERLDDEAWVRLEEVLAEA